MVMRVREAMALVTVARMWEEGVKARARKAAVRAVVVEAIAKE